MSWHRSRPGHGDLAERLGHAGTGDAELGQAVVGAVAGGVDVLALLADELDVAEAGDAREALVDAHRAVPVVELLVGHVRARAEQRPGGEREVVHPPHRGGDRRADRGRLGGEGLVVLALDLAAPQPRGGARRSG